jgi:hypothetical protein
MLLVTEDTPRGPEATHKTESSINVLTSDLKDTEKRQLQDLESTLTHGRASIHLANTAKRTVAMSGFSKEIYN